MPFVSYWEQTVIDAGVQALHQGITVALKIRFATEGEALATEARKQNDPEWLRRFLSSSETGSLEDLR